MWESMALELLDCLAIPAGHGFLREAMLAWWFVPSRYENEFARVIEALWVSDVTPARASLVLDYFRLILPPHDYPPFRGHMTALFNSLITPKAPSLHP